MDIRCEDQEATLKDQKANRKSEHDLSDSSKKRLPNVILIMTDDQGYGDLSTHGNPWIRTPNIDSLASQSVRFDDFHVSPYCIPTRASLMTGRFADRTGIHNAIEPHWFVRTSETKLSELFQDAGYVTGMFGKWHLGDNFPYGAESCGFDEVLRHHNGAIGVLGDYWDNCYVDDTYYHNGSPTQMEGYCTDIFFDAATGFIEESVKEGRPFFAYLATNTPHGPLICPPSYSAPYDKGESASIARFYGMIANIDENIGKLRMFLRENGIDRNTILIFMTDNGTASGHHLFNAGMRGNKGSPYEGGHRVPCFLHWPNGGFETEYRVNTLAAHVDIAPTLLDLCGITEPLEIKFDGSSLVPIMQNDNEEWPERILMTDTQFREPPKKWVTTAVMSERWRLVNEKELFDIYSDPGQETNVFDQHPDIVERLTSYYDQLWDEIEPTLQDVAEIPVGHEQVPSVNLTYHDCIGRHKFWYQDGIREIQSKIYPPQSDRKAFWPIDVLEAGEYEVELRRWPRELGAAIDADIPPGAFIYGKPGSRTVPGEGFPAAEVQLSIGDECFSELVEENTERVCFMLQLNKGSQEISARFIDAEGRALDVFFVYITKTDLADHI